MFAELYRKTRELERLNCRTRTARRGAHGGTRGLEHAAHAKRAGPQSRARRRPDGLVGLGSRHRRDGAGTRASIAFSASSRQLRHHASANIRALHPSRRLGPLQAIGRGMAHGARTRQTEFRVLRPERRRSRWCIGTAAASLDAAGKVVRVSGVTLDITDRKEADERQVLLAREVDHRARNALAVIQSIIRLTRAKSIDDYVRRSKAASRRWRARIRCCRIRAGMAPIWRALVTEELAPYRARRQDQDQRARYLAAAATAQGLALALHELATNAAKHGALSSPTGKIELDWQLQRRRSDPRWVENGGPQHRAAVLAQLRPEGHRRQHRAAARRQGGVRLGSEGPAVHCLYRAARLTNLGRVNAARRHGKPTAPPPSGSSNESRACFWSRMKPWSP